MKNYEMGDASSIHGKNRNVYTYFRDIWEENKIWNDYGAV
jgi:hypothetical protein